MINYIPQISPFPTADTSQFKLYPLANPRSPVSMQARIPDDLKAGGSLPTKFVVSLTPEGIKFDLVV
jgi:hypothetical protein